MFCCNFSSCKIRKMPDHVRCLLASSFLLIWHCLVNSFQLRNTNSGSIIIRRVNEVYNNKKFVIELSVYSKHALTFTPPSPFLALFIFSAFLSLATITFSTQFFPYPCTSFIVSINFVSAFCSFSPMRPPADSSGVLHLSKPNAVQ